MEKKGSGSHRPKVPGEAHRRGEAAAPRAHVQVWNADAFEERCIISAAKLLHLEAISQKDSSGAAAKRHI